MFSWSSGGALGRFHYSLIYPVTSSTLQHTIFSKYNETFLTMFNTRKRREPETWRRMINEGVCLQTIPKVNELCRISISGHQCNLNIDNLHSPFSLSEYPNAAITILCHTPQQSTHFTMITKPLSPRHLARSKH
jgi:hypothetical protein